MTHFSCWWLFSPPNPLMANYHRGGCTNLQFIPDGSARLAHWWLQSSVSLVSRLPVPPIRNGCSFDDQLARGARKMVARGRLKLLSRLLSPPINVCTLAN